MRPETRNHVLQRPAIALWLQLRALVRRGVEVGSRRHYTRALMNTKSKFALLLAASITATCSGADNTANTPLRSAVSTNTLAPTNMFSDWTGQWSNLTVTAPCPPWGCSKVTVLYEGPDFWPPIPAKKREAMQRLAERLKELEREEQRRRLLKAPALSDVYRVTLSKGTNSMSPRP